LGEEQPTNPQSFTEEAAIVWAEGRTLGNVVPFSETILGKFPKEESGSGALLPCDIVGAGKFRNGAARWWCRTHQVHWGTKADLEAALNLKNKRLFVLTVNNQCAIQKTLWLLTH
jgi:hypothetical protein